MRFRFLFAEKKGKIMTRDEFKRLAERPILLDGATGSNLIAAGMPLGVCTEKWVLAHPNVLTQLQKSYVEAGSQIVYAPTFGANRRLLRSTGVGDEVGTLNRQLVRLTQRAVKGRALVAGNATTSRSIPDVTEDYTYQDAQDLYREQFSALAEAGVDLLAVETMLSLREAAAAVEAARQVCELPVLCTMTVREDGRAFSGESAAEIVDTLQSLGADAVGLNCSTGPERLENIVREMKKASRVPLVVKPNLGMPTLSRTGKAVYHTTPEEFAAHMTRLIDAGANIVGGCCGTTPEHIRALCESMGRISCEGTAQMPCA